MASNKRATLHLKHSRGWQTLSDLTSRSDPLVTQPMFSPEALCTDVVCTSISTLKERLHTYVKA